MTKDESMDPKEVLAELLGKLQSGDEAVILHGIVSMQNLEFSSQVVRRQLEKLSLESSSDEVRREALAALGLPSNRTVQKRIQANRLDRNARHLILDEIDGWAKDGLLKEQSADVIRRRYDFDIMPQTTVQPAPSLQPTPKPVPEPPPAQPAGPRPTLLQTLTSESSIKIYLYLGAFFVIAAAAILAAAIPELRLPILILGTFIFGGLAVAIKKRLPQPSFALFIVFSFLLPITANSLEETLKAALNYPAAVSAGYWVVVYLLMAFIWGGSTWLYESRLFSITAFGSLALSLLRIGDIFDTLPEFHTLMAGLASIAGLGGVWLIKKWKDEKFALPLFLAAQFAQAATLAASITIFGVNLIEGSNPPIWHLIPFFVWGMACVFYVFSDKLYPFFIFAWLAAGALVPMPWFIAASFDLESFGSTIVLFVWGAILSIASERLQRLEWTRKFSLPILIASLPALGLGLVTGFTHETWFGMTAAFGAAVIFAALHFLRTRWWLWVLALLNFAIGYFAFFNLSFMQELDTFPGFRVLGIAILFLLPDLMLKKDWRADLEWRLPLRAFGAFFVFYLTFALLLQEETFGSISVCYAVLAVFFAAYTLGYRKEWLGYLPAAYLPLTFVFALRQFDVDSWLPVLTALSVFYFAFGMTIRSRESWSVMLRNSALALGTFVSIAALSLLKETGGWYALVIGLLFIIEMYLRRNGWFEFGAPILFTLGAFLILSDFKVEHATYHLLAYSLVWILGDLLAHLTFTNPRPLAFIVRIIGGLLALTNYAFLFGESDASIASIGFGIYSLLFLTVSLLYRRPVLFYAFTLTLPLFVVFVFRTFDVTKWIHPVIVLAVGYYASGLFLRTTKRAEGWNTVLLNSGLGVGSFVSVVAPVLGGLDAAIPVAIAATLWAVEAFAKRNPMLAFLANGLYLLGYFIILWELKVDEPQFYSMGAALLGLIQHYLLVRAGSRTGAFIMGMLSQFVLLGTTYIQLLGDIAYFFLLFLQSLAVLVYGIVIRSRSLTFFPIGFAALGVVTVVYGAFKDIGSIFLIGCTGILLLMLGILAVLLRERIAKLGERLSEWKP